MKVSKISPLFILCFFALSLIFHLIFLEFIAPPLLPFFLFDNPSVLGPAKESQVNKRMELTQITKDELQKLRTVGKKDGKEGIFNIPIMASPADPPAITRKNPVSSHAKGPSPGPSNAREKINLRSLGSVNINDKYSQINDLGQLDHESPGQSEGDRPALKKVPSFQEYFDTKIGQYSEMFKVNPAFFKSSDFKIVLETPKGVEIDKLNSIELIFYSFHRRVFESYISSIFKAYESFKMENPHLDLGKFGKQTLKAKVFYDNNGNIIKILDVKNSEHKQIHDFFRSILINNRIPNPPKDILNKDGGFNLEFQLTLNV